MRMFEGEPVDPARSRIMSSIRGRDTGPELALRRAVSALGGRYRTHPSDVPGRPDLANKAARVAVFVDGCFWHRCPAHFRQPKARGGYWEAKIERNVRRREDVRAQFGPGWRVVEVFECALRADLGREAHRVARLLTAPRPAPASTRKGPPA